jgi:hypothetical protein
MNCKETRSQGLNVCRIDAESNLEHVWENRYDEAKEEDICDCQKVRGRNFRKASLVAGRLTAKESNENCHHNECL